MTEKVIGYVELEWTCPICQNRNPGSQKICKSCGSAQPENVQFENPVEQKLIQDEAVVARAQKAPDRHCPYCDARNPADAKTCSQCAADLSKASSRSAGATVEGYKTGAQPPILCATCGSANPARSTTCANCGAPLRKPKPAAIAAERHEQGMSLGFLFALCGIVMLVVFWLLFMTFRTETIVGSVNSAEWTRRVDIQGLVPVREQDWEDQIPSDALGVGQCSLQLRDRSSVPVANGREVCGTPYTEDTGNGFGRVKQECWYEVYENMCSYTVERWRTVNTVASRGVGFEPFWPELALDMNQRVGGRNEEYRCTLLANDQQYSYSPAGFNEYLLCQPGQQVQLSVNGFGSVTSLDAFQ